MTTCLFPETDYIKFTSDIYKRAIISLLTKIYIREFSNSLDLKNIPNEVIENTKEYNQDNDPISSWFNENYETFFLFLRYIGKGIWLKLHQNCYIIKRKIYE
jgi:hypothetical protein